MNSMYHRISVRKYQDKPVERCSKIGIIGASTTGMMALLAASYYPEITLTIAVSPSDFVMEGFYQDGKDGMHERPGDNESTVTWQGKPLPYLPYAYRHPEYWQQIKADSKAGGDMIASRRMFDESERRHPLQEEEKSKSKGSKGRSSLLEQRMTCSGTHANISAGWSSAFRICRMTAHRKPGCTNTAPTLPFPNRC